MATGKGVIQGFTGVAAVDGKHQVIVAAEAHGTGSEQGLLLPVVEALRTLLDDGSLITVDAGYHSEANLKALEAHRIESLIADNGIRQHDCTTCGLRAQCLRTSEKTCTRQVAFFRGCVGVSTAPRIVRNTVVAL